MVNARYIAGCAAVLVGMIAGGCNERANYNIRRLTEVGVEQAIVSGVRTKMEGPRGQTSHSNDNYNQGNNTGYEGNMPTSPEETARFERSLREQGILGGQMQKPSPEETARFEAALREQGILGGQINNSSPEEIDRFERSLREQGILGSPNK